MLLHYFVIQGAKLRRRNKCNAIAVKIKSAIKSVKINYHKTSGKNTKSNSKLNVKLS